jgi:membrane protein
MPSDTHSTLDAARGARAPAAMPMRSWRRVLARVAGTVGDRNLTLIAAGCSFYALLSLAPTLAALASVYGFFADPAAIARHLDALRDIAPPAAYDIIRSQADALSGARTALGWTSVASVLFAVWTARIGVGALMTGVTVAYRETGSRGFLRETAATYLLTLVFIAIAAFTLGAIVVLPAVLAWVPIGDLAATVANIARWPLGLAATLLGLSVLYRYGPPRRPARLSWVSPGAVAAVALWLVGSVAFTRYLANFADYNETYGALGAVAALLMWFWLSALAALIGASINAELEHETAQDTTIGPERPLGERGAYVADHRAEA